MCIVREKRPAGFLDMKCQTCYFSGLSSWSGISGPSARLWRR